MELGIPFGRFRAGFRLRKTIRNANRITPVRVIGVGLVLVVCSAGAWATTYYVSSRTGNDLNNGSISAPWQTIAHVNGQTFQPGDSILFKRGDVWNESLAPVSSGSEGNPITFDAYGTGAAPNLTGYYAVPSTAWAQVTGNAWKAPLPTTYTTVNFCLFGSVWGQKVAAATSNLTAQGNFYLANGYIYIFSAGNPVSAYSQPIVPMALSNVPVINVNGQSWLTFQHFLVNWFDEYGVYVQGSSDHLVFANMEADSMIPQGTQPLGFYLNESVQPTDIRFYDDEAHLNYEAFRFDGFTFNGVGTPIILVNDKAYANRDGALVDNTGKADPTSTTSGPGAANYSYCHFYASSLAVANSTDVEWAQYTLGPTAGAGNIAADTPPAVQAYQRYPAEVTLTVDDAGMTQGTDTYYSNTVLPIADAAAVPVGAAITVGYPLAQTLIPEFQGWINAGRDVTSHSISHTYYTNTSALAIQYTGVGTAATLEVSGKVLTITVTGANDSVSYNLAQGQPQGTILGLQTELNNTGRFTASLPPPPCQGPYGTGCSFYTEAALLAQDLADVSSQDVKNGVYQMQLDVTRLTTDEITLSRQWMTKNLTGLPPTAVYVYPGGYETTPMQRITAGVPYEGARGALKEDLGVKDTYADGFNVQNITSFGVNPSWMGLPPATLNQKIQALVWKESVWGVPWGIFWHWNSSSGAGELSATEVTNLIADLQASGATILTNTGLVNWLLSGAQETGTDGGYYYTFPATNTVLDFRPTMSSPVVDAGQNLGATYELDINGVNQNSYGSGWEIGAHVYQGYAMYGAGSGAGKFAVGSGVSLAALAMPTLPQVWVNNHEGDSLFEYELSLPSSWVTGPPSDCVFHTPYWTGSPTTSGLQSAINDIEACRTGTGVGIKLDIPPALYTSAAGLTIPQTSNTPATKFLILASTQDSSLPNGQTVCSHGIQDNLAVSTDVGIDNPSCNGSGMYYQLGTTQNNISSGSLTLANGTVTNTLNYDDVQYMWTVETTSTSGVVLQACSPLGTSSSAQPPLCGATAIGPDHWLIEDMEARMGTGVKDANYIVSLGQTGTETSTAQYPTHIHFRKDWIHGDWSSLTAGANSVSAGMLLWCTYCSLVDSQISQIVRPGAEGHGITAQGTTLKVDHNWIEGGSSAIFPGGFSSLSGPPVFGYVPYCDVEVRRNRLTYPYAWLGQSPVTSNPNYGSFSLVRKNSVENKEACRVVYAGNILENVDNSGAQSGPGLLWQDLNRSAGGMGQNYQSVIRDMTFTNNIVRNTCNGLTMARSTSSISNGDGGTAHALANLWFYNNLFYNVSTSNPGCTGSSVEAIALTSFGQQWQGTITANNGTATFVANCEAEQGNILGTGGTCMGQILSLSIASGGTGCTGNGSLTFSGGSQQVGGVTPAGTYTCSGRALTTVTLTNPGSQFLGTPTAVPASGSGTVTVTIVTIPAPPGVGWEVMNISKGDPVEVSFCTAQTGFNILLTSYGGVLLASGVGPAASAGSAAWTGTFNSAGVTVSFPSAVSGTDNGGYCTVTNMQGGPQNFIWQHNTLVTDNSRTITSNNTRNSGGPNFQIKANWRDSIMLGGGWDNSDRGTGTPSEVFNYDITSLTTDHVLWPGQTASSYTAYGNNPAFPAGSPAVYFPSAAYCTGSTPIAYTGAGTGCVGWTGAMSMSSLPLSLPDYHNWSLISGSSFKAGGAYQASDGTDMGASIPAIDAAQTQHVYVCGTPCGMAGPWPD